MPLLIQYSEDNKSRTTLDIVNTTADFRKFPVVKSTDSNLPDQLSFKNDDGSLKEGVLECDGIFDGCKVQYASVLKIVTTLKDIQDNNISNIESSFKQANREAVDAGEVGKLPLIKVQKEKLLRENSEATTLQEAEAIKWVEVPAGE
jgi:hypothetical protein